VDYVGKAKPKMVTEIVMMMEHRDCFSLGAYLD
jgi:hypothetical protein